MKHSSNTEQLKKWLLEVEDKRFYQHGALDFKGILRAIVRNLGAGKVVSELTTVLAGNAHLLPQKHYYVIMSLIEKATVLPNKALDMAVVNDTRAYIYRQIEILNYLLYKRDNSFDPLTNTAFLGTPLALLRTIANVTIHLSIWGLLAGFVYMAYYFFKEDQVLWLVLYSLVLALPLLVDAERRIEMRREAVDHRIARNRYGLLAMLRWCKKQLR